MTAELGWLVVLRFLRNRCLVTRVLCPRGLVTHSCPAETETDYTTATALDSPTIASIWFLQFSVVSDYTTATALVLL